MSEGPGGLGRLVPVIAPRAMAATLRTDRARAALHAFRADGDAPVGPAAKLASIV